jgi:hypothetical protein
LKFFLLRNRCEDSYAAFPAISDVNDVAVALWRYISNIRVYVEFITNTGNYQKSHNVGTEMEVRNIVAILINFIIFAKTRITLKSRSCKKAFYFNQ